MNLPRLSRAAALGALFAGHAAVAGPAVFTLEPAHSFVQFELLHFGTSTARGRFGPISGQVTLDRAAGSGSARIVIDTASVSTGLRVFDARIRRSDLLASDDFPQAVFSAESFRFEGERLVEVGGTLSLHGVSRPLVLRALRFGCETRAGREVCGGDFEGELLRSDFGVDYLVPLVADRVRLLVQVEGARPEAARP
ncbi:MAG: YceI family protein [Rhizobacter sp.]|nr:YceI family protein [Burkholderiaceae bacterium]MCO5122494.1 YceI family protein [Rhizobacter sp.]